MTFFNCLDHPCGSVPALEVQENEAEASDVEDYELNDNDHMQDLPEADVQAKAKGFQAVHQRLLSQPGGAAAAAAAERNAAEVRQLLEQYHELEYEDHVGGVATRFRWAPEFNCASMQLESICWL